MTFVEGMSNRGKERGSELSSAREPLLSFFMPLSRNLPDIDQIGSRSESIRAACLFFTQSFSSYLLSSTAEYVQIYRFRPYGTMSRTAMSLVLAAAVLATVLSTG